MADVVKPTLGEKTKTVAKEAATKMTTYVALAIASAGELRDEWPQIIATLPSWSWLVLIEKHVFLVLGVLLVIARVRRIVRKTP